MGLGGSYVFFLKYCFLWGRPCPLILWWFVVCILIGSLNIFGMDYSTILLVGLLNNFCDGMLFWFWWLLVAMVLLLSRLIDYSLDFGYVLVVLIYLCCLVDWFLIGLWVCFGCYDLFVWCYGGWLLWNVVCMFAVVEDGKMGKGHSNLYILYISYHMT